MSVEIIRIRHSILDYIKGYEVVINNIKGRCDYICDQNKYIIECKLTTKNNGIRASTILQMAFYGKMYNAKRLYLLHCISGQVTFYRVKIPKSMSDFIIEIFKNGYDETKINNIKNSLGLNIKTISWFDDIDFISVDDDNDDIL